MLPIGAEIMRAVAPRVSGRRAQRQAFIIENAAKVLADTLQKYEINTALRVAHFLAQTCHESDGFCTTVEYASGAAYEGRIRGLGNTQPGDGKKFKGRGIIQLTGRANYAAAGKRLKLDLVGNPDLAAEPATSVLTACDFWKSRKINPPCDQDDIIKVTKLINGGLNGLESRRAYLAKAKTALAKLQAGQVPASVGTHPTLRRGMQGDDVTRLQKALCQKGVLVAIDAVFGPGTETAVRQFQLSNHLTVDGIVGPATWKALLSARAPPTLRRGMKGDDVTRLQEALRQKGVSVAIDAVFGPGTETAVRQFQLSNHLTADGIVGPATWKALTSSST